MSSWKRIQLGLRPHPRHFAAMLGVLLSVRASAVMLAEAGQTTLQAKRVEYLHFLEEEITYQQVFADQTLAWSPNPVQLTPSRSAWLKITFEAQNVSALDELVFVLSESLPRQASFYLLKSSGELVSQSVVGSGVPLGRWRFVNTVASHVFRLSEPGEYVMLLHLNTSFLSTFHFELMKHDDYMAIERRSNIQTAMVIGGLSLVLVYNMLLWRSLRRRIFLHFAVLNGLYLLLTLEVEGVLGALTAAAAPEFSKLLRIIPFVTMGAFLNFSAHYLRAKIELRMYERILACARLLWLCAIVSFISPAFAQIVALIDFSVGMILVLFGATRLMFAQQRDAMLLIVGTLPLFGVFLLGLPIANHYFGMSMRNTLPLALIFQILCIGSALADRITEVRRKLLESLAARADDLEAQVKERTHKYELANDELRHEVEERRLAEQLALEQARLLQEAQARLISSSRMSAVGEMAAGISHEINNPLTIVKGYIFLMQDILKKPEIDREHLQAMVVKVGLASERMTKVIRSLREFTLQDTLDTPTDTFLSESWHMVMRLIGERLNASGIEGRFADLEANGGLKVVARPVDLVQTIIGIINNAIDAIDKLPHKWIEVHVLYDETYVTLRFIDSGSGISPDIEEKIFSPFFTTKDPGSGMGMGLSVARQMMRSVGGDLRCISGQKHTTFEIMLERAAADSQPEDLAS